MFDASFHRGTSDGNRSYIPKTAVVSVWSEQCDISVCKRIHQYLSVRNRVCHDQSGDESVHQFSGIWENRNAHGNAWRIYQYCAGSDPDFRTGYGSTGSSPCNGDLPGLICSLGDEVSDREEGDSSTLQKSNASGVEACKRNHLSGNIGICDVCYKRACTDCMQCNAPEVRG